jgi:rare lipoprotein A
MSQVIFFNLILKTSNLIKNTISYFNKLNFSYCCLIFFILLTSCSTSHHSLHKQLSKHDPENTKYQGHYKTGKPYQINSLTYHPYKNLKDDHVETGLASWYGKNDHGKKTANGDVFNKNLLTAAHPKLPMPCIVKVTNLHNNKSAILMVNDRGPFYKNRIVDVSEAAAERLQFKKQGKAHVKLEYMHDETTNLLARLDLNKREGCKAKKKFAVANNCSINCYLNLLNVKHGSSHIPKTQKKLYQKSIVLNNI